MTLYLDIETHPIARAALAPRAVCVQTCRPEGPPRIDLWRDFDFRAALADTIVGANVAYDMAVAAAMDLDLLPLIFDAYDQGRIVDVQLDAKLLDIAAGEYGHRSIAGWNLQELARRVGVRIDKDSDDETGDGSWRVRFGQLDGIPIANWPAGAVRYALDEMPATRAVHQDQMVRRAEWQARGLDPLGYHSGHAALSAFALHLSSCQGILTNPAAVAHVAGRLEAHLAGIGRRLRKARLVRPDGSRDTKRAARAMVDACQRAGLDVPMTEGAAKKESDARAKLAALQVEHTAATPRRRAGLERKGQEVVAQWHKGIHTPGVQIDRDQVILSGSRVLELYADYSSANLVTGRLDRLRQGYTVPLQTRFDPLKETGRTSSTQPGEPLEGEQMQNFARASGITPAEKKAERDGAFFWGLRECFAPRPGNAIIAADLSMAELHTVAQICITLFGYSKLGELLNAGTDVHKWLAAVTLGLDLGDLSLVPKLDRQRVKPGNFGFWGGMGAEKFVLYSRKGYGIRFTVAEAKAFKAQWAAAFPETRPYFQWINSLQGESATFTHVHPITGFVRGGCYYASGANTGFQSLCAYGAKLALYRVTRACFDPESPLFGFRVWNFIHDEIVAEGPLTRASAAAIELGRITAATFNEFVPDVPTKAEPYMSTVWSKHAETIRTPEGLGLWVPPAWGTT